MKILILGGTVFLGRALVDAARSHGHQLTLFNRGKSNPAAYPEIEQIHGDRDGGLGALAGRRWDAVIDTCGYIPRVVRQSAGVFAGAADQYVFISTLSVYADARQPGIDEHYRLGTLDDESVETINGETYGPLKALCEQAVQQNFPEHVLIIRPGLIVGPYDPSDRFTYWPVRVARGGEVLAPGSPERGVQFIDVRDLAEWTLNMLEIGNSGIFNVDGVGGRVSMGSLLEACRHVSGSQATFTWVDEGFLAEQQVGPWMEMPLWIPESDPDSVGFFSMSVEKALQSGLTFRPLTDTLRATLAWADSRPADHAWRAGLKPEREVELLELYRRRRL